MTRPIAYRISQWDSCTEIIYKCSKCNTSFAALGYNEKYCHNCGEEQDWTVATHLKDPFSNHDSIEEENKILAEINKQNSEGRYK